MMSRPIGSEIPGRPPDEWCIARAPAPPAEDPPASRSPFRVADKVSDNGKALPDADDMEALARKAVDEVFR